MATFFSPTGLVRRHASPCGADRTEVWSDLPECPNYGLITACNYGEQIKNLLRMINRLSELSANTQLKVRETRRYRRAFPAGLPRPVSGRKKDGPWPGGSPQPISLQLRESRLAVGSRQVGGDRRGRRRGFDLVGEDGVDEVGEGVAGERGADEEGGRQRDKDAAR